VQRNATPLRIIQQGVSKSIYLRIFYIKKAIEGWKILRNEFKALRKPSLFGCKIYGENLKILQ
jgi:hypothetical protein